jgi:hypothetical protein
VPLSYDESTKGLDETSKKLRAFFNQQIARGAAVQVSLPSDKERKK